MTIIHVPLEQVRSKRRRAEEVLDMPESGPSARGSTYWRRLLGCPREHFLANELGWVPVDRTDPLEFGLIWHWALEELYQGMYDNQRGVRASESPEARAWRKIKPFDGEPGYEEGWAKLSNMLDSYLSRWYAIDSQQWEIEAIEETLAVDLGEGFGFEWSNRMDLRILDHSTPGSPVRRHVEHKSTYRMDGEVIIGYGMDLQITGQAFLMGEHFSFTRGDHHDGIPYLGAIVNITARPYVSASMEARKPAENHRMLVQPTQDDLVAWAQSMAFWQRWKATLDKLGDYPRNYNNCVRRYGRCQFFNLCQSRSSDTVSSLRDLDAQIRAGEASHPPGYRYANRNDSEEV